MSEIDNIPEGWVETEIGNIPIDWKCVNFIEVGDDNVKRPFISGPFGSNISSKFFVESGVPVIRGNNLKLGIDNKFNDEGFAYLTKEKANELGTYAEKDDIIFTAAGTIGQVGIIEEKNKYSKYIISNKQLRARLNKKNVLPIYSYYWFSSPIMEKILKKRNTGSTIPLINLTILKTLPLPLPPLPEQKAIASILTSFDDKIELLQAQNKTLETIAQTIFKEWFGKYQIGDDLPEGWRVGEYSDLVKLSSGKGVKKSDYIKDGKYQIIGANGKIGRLNKFLINEKVILTGRVGTLGTVFMLNKPAWISDNVLINKPCIENSFYFTYFTLKGFNFFALNTGSTQPLITQRDLKSVNIIIPESIILKKYEEKSNILFSKIEINTAQIQTLKKTRDTLLPKLMSGQLRVQDNDIR